MSLLSSYSNQDKNEDDPLIAKYNLVNGLTPINENLSAKYYSSAAFKFIQNTAPNIVGNLIDFLRENEKVLIAEYGDYAHHDLKGIVWCLEILHDDLLSNKPFKLFYGKEPDTADWNHHLKLLKANNSKWYNAKWLHAHCYFYRRISTTFKRTENLRDFDYFESEKRNSLEVSVKVMELTVHATRGLERSKEDLQLMLQLAVWGENGGDQLKRLSLAQQIQILIHLVPSEKNLLVNDSEKVWQLLDEASRNASVPCVVDIVCNTAGFELFTDLLLAEYLIEVGLARKVRFHVKAIPWCIYSATAQDFNWLLGYLRRSKIRELSVVGHRLRGFLKDGFIELCDSCHFWTSPYDFHRMRELNPCLYVHLSFATLVIFKGDFNYRKLLSDVRRESTEPFINCLWGFLPTSICALRIIKSDIYCGLSVCVEQLLNEDNSNWVFDAEKALIQLAIKPRP